MRELARGAVAAAGNARGLVEDAELLSGAGRLARAYSLAGLAVEEVGKAGSLATLAAMPDSLRARAPLGRMLEWHQMKLVAGELIAAMPFGVPGRTRPTSASSSTGRGGPPRRRLRCSTPARHYCLPNRGPPTSSSPVRWSARSARQDLPEVPRLPRTCCATLPPSFEAKCNQLRVVI